MYFSEFYVIDNDAYWAHDWHMLLSASLPTSTAYINKTGSHFTRKLTRVIGR